MALKCETTLDLDVSDLAAILTKELCDNYNAFRDLRVEHVCALDDGQTFQLTMTPRPKEPEAAA